MRVVVQSLGMVSPLGPAIQACAAFRAGITRIHESSSLTCAVQGESGPQPVPVCEIPVATLGASGVGRLVAIACDMLKDLHARSNLEQLPDETELFVGMPDPLDRGIPVAPELRDNEGRRLQAFGRRVFEQTYENLGLKWTGGKWRFHGGDHSAFAAALAGALKALVAGRTRTCLVAALDSLVAPDVLETLLSERRLKTGDNPVGFIPGEAGAAVLLTTFPSKALSSKEPRVVVRSVTLAHEQRHRGSDVPVDGRTLAHCVSTVIKESGAAEDELLLISDLDGEQSRATEWGMLQLQLRARGFGQSAIHHWVPATSFGHLGAAFGGVGMCIAVRGLQRRYAPTLAPIIVSAADGGERGAVLISAEQQRAPGR